MKYFILILSLLAAVILMGCQSGKNNEPAPVPEKPAETVLQEEKEEPAEEAKEEAKVGAKTTESGLGIEDATLGEGDAVKDGDTVKVHYTGLLKDGKVFDSSKERHEPFEFTVGAGEVIKGWDEGLVGMKKGGKRLLTIPAELAYGDREVGDIPANSTLYFEIELLEIIK